MVNSDGDVVGDHVLAALRQFRVEVEHHRGAAHRTTHERRVFVHYVGGGRRRKTWPRGWRSVYLLATALQRETRARVRRRGSGCSQRVVGEERRSEKKQRRAAFDGVREEDGSVKTFSCSSWRRCAP